MKHRLWALVLLPMLPGFSFADAVQPPEPVPGTVLEYSGNNLGLDCNRWVINGVEAGVLTATCNQYQSFSEAANDFNLHRIEDAEGRALITFDPYYPALKRPLAAGDKWRGSYKAKLATFNAEWRGSVRCKVDDLESVTVAAGPFDALPVRCIDNIAGNGFKSVERTTRWYVPELGIVVKFENQQRGSRNFELTAFEVPSSSVSP